MRCVSILVVLALSGCGAWTKPGGSPEQQQADQQACGLAPPRIISTPQPPPVTDRRCTDLFGQAPCTPAPLPPTATQPDLNAGARSVAFEQCLDDRGYTFSTR
jgi:hypothetical protein